MEITELIRHDIFDLFENGCIEQIYFGSDKKYFIHIMDDLKK